LADPFEELHRQLRRIGAAAPSRDWADRILTRAALGETLPAIALRFARQARGEWIEREPGSDDESN